VPAVAERLERAVFECLKMKARLIGRDLRVPLKTTLAEESTVGQDRLLGALAAYVNVEAACVIIHAGSALVVDCIDSEGVFRGGAIAPGLAMGARALHEYAAQLPAVVPAPPAEDVIFGRDTQAAINLGLYAGLRGTVRELLERYASVLGAWPHVVATGGDAQLLPAEIVDSFVPDLVLQGAALTWENDRNGE
jgi:type III pantothenate kinase